MFLGLPVGLPCFPEQFSPNKWIRFVLFLYFADHGGLQLFGYALKCVCGCAVVTRYKVQPRDILDVHWIKVRGKQGSFCTIQRSSLFERRGCQIMFWTFRAWTLDNIVIKSLLLRRQLALIHTYRAYNDGPSWFRSLSFLTWRHAPIWTGESLIIL